MREYLEALDVAYEEIATPQNISLTNSQARWTAAPGGLAFYAYSTNYLIDIGYTIIVNVEPTSTHRSLEIESTKLVVGRVEQDLDIKSEQLIGDTAYGTAPMLKWMVQDKGIEPHVSVWEKPENNLNIFNRSDFVWDRKVDCYHCPGSQQLQVGRRNFKVQHSHVTKANTIIYRANQHDCNTCELKSHCCPNRPKERLRIER